MRKRLERFAVMPFAITCATPSSIAIKEPQRIRKPSGDSVPSSPAKKSEFKYVNATNRSLEPSKSLQKEQSVSRSPPVESSMFTFSLSKSHLSSKLQRLIKSFRALSQLFVYKEEEEMQIGYPTDVKHVAHIGWDGPSGTGKSWMGELAGTADRSSDFEQPRCSSWMEDASSIPSWASHDLLGSLGLPATNNHADAPQFNIFKAADAKDQKSKSKQRKRNLQMI